MTKDGLTIVGTVAPFVIRHLLEYLDKMNTGANRHLVQWQYVVN